MAALAKLVPASSSWWEDEVAALIADMPALTSVVRRSVRSVLFSLRDDAATDDETRSDVEAVLEALQRPVLVRHR